MSKLGLFGLVCPVAFYVGYVSARWAPRRWLGLLIGTLFVGLGAAVLFR